MPLGSTNSKWQRLNCGLGLSNLDYLLWTVLAQQLAFRRRLRHFLTTPIGGVVLSFSGIEPLFSPCVVLSVKLSTHIDNARATRFGFTEDLSCPTTHYHGYAIRYFAPIIGGNHYAVALTESSLLSYSQPTTFWLPL